ncbi:cholinesterase-like [Ambystoma mexicanum]|uniref:cholinesterase-like n=1 Tax=Ambystoma mexicanum TaxID=8296 RepID=UPI0037E71BC2
MWRKRGRGQPWACCCLFVVFVFLGEVHAEDHDPVVFTKKGPVRGTILNSTSGPVTAFLGIPFGQPPVGALRFKRPLPAKSWQGIRNATNFGNACYQKLFEPSPSFEDAHMWYPKTEISEDCLNLNVWVPSPSGSNVSVMVFIYGGAFLGGASSLPVYDPRNLVQAENIIVVSMNYRIGPLGFLALPGNSEAPGNAGLFDQQLALSWVQENIAAFGGNPDSVTLFGMSAGAVSVDYHMLSPLSRPLFTRAITESGSINSPWSFLADAEAKNTAFNLAQLVGCSLTNESELIACLQAKSPKEITDHQFPLVPPDRFLLSHFVPTVDGVFLTDTPKKLIEQGQFKRAQMLSGVTRDEGSIFLYMDAHRFSKGKDALLSTREFKEAIAFFFPHTGEQGVESITSQYTDPEDENNPEKNRNALIQAFGDFNFVCPMTAWAKTFTEHGNKLFLYYFDHRSSQEVLPEWTGVVHCAERPFLIGKPLERPTNYSRAEQDLSERIMRYWANFAKYGNPNGQEESINAWPVFSSKEQKYVSLNTKPLQSETKLHEEQCKFWKSYLQNELKRTAL